MLTKMDKVALTFLAICLFPVLILAALSEILSAISAAWCRKANALMDKVGW